MSRLHNILSKKELKKRMYLDTTERLTLSFYKYFNIINTQEYRNKIYKQFLKYNILGRVYIAEEGINAQISVPLKNFTFLKNFLFQLSSSLHDIVINKALSNQKSFWVLSVKVKKNIVADGIQDFFFNPHDVGIYINAQEVNLMLKDQNVIFIDMRNSYEYKIGHFEHAIEIKSTTFREQLKKLVKKMEYAKHKRIVLYCTGGIRCEKATAWMRFHDFKYIYHIKGGIIGYIHNAKKNNLPILFKGKNFVFDNRMSEKVSDDVIAFCQQCKNPSDVYVNCRNDLCHLLFIQCKDCAVKFNYCCSKECMKKIKGF
ncbi:rhodanese-related sulfurtransferase [Buchnera aphidicola (Hyadaphis tataricae)]|uniref:tRNA uridine(34) hydroxylase n=1 Tax=Buchnera aphidicola (Hyadaphis tataricae) TaxID=1241859 RepID=A0A4D6Y5N8_9GAMM|nr:rhodanese-related sulfurtransferase [Buchnera aphidicola]QCI21658.1 rhodanese-related sulfurtransferase [Buchnera aphidicola (Hyadaphis tataricae)]